MVSIVSWIPQSELLFLTPCLDKQTRPHNFHIPVNNRRDLPRYLPSWRSTASRYKWSRASWHWARPCCLCSWCFFCLWCCLVGHFCRSLDPLLLASLQTLPPDRCRSEKLYPTQALHLWSLALERSCRQSGCPLFLWVEEEPLNLVCRAASLSPPFLWTSHVSQQLHEQHHMTLKNSKMTQKMVVTWV